MSCSALLATKETEPITLAMLVSCFWEWNSLTLALLFHCFGPNATWCSKKGFEHHSQAALTQIPISHRPVRDHFSDKTKKEQMQTHKPLLQCCSIMFLEKPCSHSYTVRALTKHYFKSLEHSVRLASTWEHFICVVNILEELWNSALQQRICPEFWRQDTV